MKICAKKWSGQEFNTERSLILRLKFLANLADFNFTVTYGCCTNFREKIPWMLMKIYVKTCSDKNFVRKETPRSKLDNAFHISVSDISRGLGELFISFSI